MKKKRFVLMAIALFLVCTMALNLVGCAEKSGAKDLMAGVTPKDVKVSDGIDSHNAAVTDFAIRLFKSSKKDGENTLISPLSVLCALAMTANGAQGETLAQMEEIFGISAEELNLYLHSYMSKLPKAEKYKLSLANSIWFTEDERFTVSGEFIQTNADYYGADIYIAPFNKQTCKDINNWVKDKTDGMIPEILDDIPSDAIMYLVNALAFEAEWDHVYLSHQIKKGEFTKEDGSKQDAEYMHSVESIYLEDEKAIGFMKHYYGGKYAFAALLPKEGISLSEYVDFLDGKSLNELLEDPQYTSVRTALPKFETGYTVEMSEILTNMGMPKAFSCDAEFGGLGTSTAGNIFISRVLHKTFISVGEKGTKAGAATLVEMVDGAIIEPDKQVYLDRPFVYMLVDCENNIPFFIGTMTDIKN